MDQGYPGRNTLVAMLARLYPSGTRKTDVRVIEPDWDEVEVSMVLQTVRDLDCCALRSRLGI